MSEVIRRALEEEAKQRRLKELKEAAEDLGKLFADIPKEELIKDFKETREQG